MNNAAGLPLPGEAEFDWPEIPRHRLSPSSDAPVFLESSGEDNEMLVLSMEQDGGEDFRLILNGHEAYELAAKILGWAGRRELLVDA